MGALVAAVDKSGRDAARLAKRMMAALIHRGADAFGLATSSSIDISPTIDGLKAGDIKAEAAIGYNLSKVLPQDNAQPNILSDSRTFVFEGSLYPQTDSGSRQAAKIALQSTTVPDFFKHLHSIDGDYVVAVLDKNELFITRDTFGTRPLYYAENDSIVAFASERKALHAIGLQAPISFTPGWMAEVSRQGLEQSPIRTLEKPQTILLSEDEASAKLHALLVASTRKRIAGLKSIAVAFSGGLDSAVTAALVKEQGVEVMLVATGLEGSPELEHARKAAEALALPLEIKTHSEREVEATLPEVLWHIEEANPMKVETAIPLYWTANFARSLGYRTVFAGQGSDELYGGYRKFATLYGKEGKAAVEESLFIAVRDSYQVNFQRDEQVFSPNGVELRLPFVDWDVVSFSLSLPVEMKVTGADDGLRKHVLRRVGKLIGLPDFISLRRKKAIQHGTRVSPVLRKLARKRGLSLAEYLVNVQGTLDKRA